VNADHLKLTVCFGESDRVGGRLLSDVLVELFERHQLRSGVLLRAVEGFGIKHALRTDRFLTLSEDLPLVAVGLDERARIEAILPELAELVAGGLVTLEHVQLVDGGLVEVELREELREAVKLTVYLGRDERVGRRPAFFAIVDHLRATGLDGATVLLGVDGMVHRERRRARFFSRNEEVPLLVVCVGAGDAVSRALPGLDAWLVDPIVTLERAQVCKRDAVLIAEPRRLPLQDDGGLGVWQRLTVYAGEQSRHAGHPLSIELVRRLRSAGAGGATSLRGIWGFSGDHAPHGDRLFRVRRHVPVVTTIVDTPDRIQRWFPIVDECTREAGLVTSEFVPACRAVGVDGRIERLALARIRF
jgi:PII-like signaling protein